MCPAPTAVAGFFPLDKELALPDGQLLPHAQQTLVRLSTEVPFARAVRDLQAILGITLSRSTARRQTFAVGHRCLAVQQQQAEPQATCREEPATERLLMSVDGAFVPLVGGQWEEVKLLVIGEVQSQQSQQSQQAKQSQTTKLSYFARLADAATFADEASAEIRRRGVERAKEVCAVQDGAEWLQGFVQAHRHDAVRILDFAHAAGYVSQIGEAIHACGGHLPAGWLAGVLHRLKHEGPERVLRHLHQLLAHFPQAQAQEQMQYLDKRRDLMQYHRYRQDGWPIGSGCVESGHKLVMQARMKRAGMHWERANVNPMLTLRTTLCNDRWDEGWQEQRRLREQQRQARRRLRQQQYVQAHQVKQPTPSPASKSKTAPHPKTGRTQTQYQWGRHTISHRRLQQAGGAKK